MRHVMETLMQTQEGEEDEITWRRWRRECLVWTLIGIWIKCGNVSRLLSNSTSWSKVVMLEPLLLILTLTNGSSPRQHQQQSCPRRTLLQHEVSYVQGSSGFYTAPRSHGHDLAPLDSADNSENEAEVSDTKPLFPPCYVFG
ncbi:hypothetical protein EMCRGX_G011806 [Ephydatia muelleri]